MSDKDFKPGDLVSFDDGYPPRVPCAWGIVVERPYLPHALAESQRVLVFWNDTMKPQLTRVEFVFSEEL